MATVKEKIDIETLKKKIHEQTKTREQLLKELFKADFELYYKNEEEILELEETAYGEASRLCDELEPLLDRFNTIYTIAADVIATETKELGNKTEISSFYKGFYRSLERKYERTRMKWNKGEQRAPKNI